MTVKDQQKLLIPKLQKVQNWLDMNFYLSGHEIDLSYNWIEVKNVPCD